MGQPVHGYLFPLFSLSLPLFSKNNGQRMERSKRSMGLDKRLPPPLAIPLLKWQNLQPTR